MIEITSIKQKIYKFKKRLNSLTAKDYYFFLSRIDFTSNDEFRNKFVYQPILDSLELRKDKGTEYIVSRKSKRLYNSKLKLLYTALLHT